jgi:alkyldihydroxyacetonephosphate synthase
MSHPPRAAAYAQRIVPEPPAPQPPGEESLDVWGFADSGFRVNEAGQVEFRGARYAFSGKVIPNLLPWAETILGLPLDPKQRRASGYPTALPERFGNEPLERAFASRLPAERISTDPRARLRHGHGHRHEDMWAVKHGRLARVPDLAVWPVREKEVRARRWPTLGLLTTQVPF